MVVLTLLFGALGRGSQSVANLGLGVGIVADFKEDLLESSDGDAISLDFKHFEVVVEVSEEVFEVLGALARDLHSHFTLDLRQLANL